MTLTLFSFGHKHGPPLDADLVLDARLLPNPYWVAALKEHRGTEPQVAAYVLDNDIGREFLKLLLPFLAFCLTTAQQNGKETFTVAIGCTGGRHRSVAVVEEVARQIGKEVTLRVIHRDIAKE